METITQHEITAAFIARVFLGLLFFFQGYDAVFNIKIKNVIQAYEDSFASKGIPRFLTVAGAWFTSFIEFIGGLLLILGVFQYYVLSLLGLDLIIASIAFGIASPMWDTKHVFPRLLLVLLLLIMPESWNLFSLDSLFTYLYK
jgi:putative oxidoreductase